MWCTKDNDNCQLTLTLLTIATKKDIKTSFYFTKKHSYFNNKQANKQTNKNNNNKTPNMQVFIADTNKKCTVPTKHHMDSHHATAPWNQTGVWCCQAELPLM